MSVCCPVPSSLDPDGSDSPRRHHRTRQWLNLGIASLLASQTMIISLAVNLSPIVATSRLFLHLILILSTVGVFALVGLPLVRDAWEAVRQRRIAIEQLFLLGIIGAFVASITTSLTGHGSVYYEVVSILLGIYLFGKLMADQRRESVEQASFQISRQFSACERLHPSGRWEKVAAHQICVGDQIMIRAGGSISVDGRVIHGVAYVRETPLTGEPFPVVKRVGDQVLAGSEVIDADLTLEATAGGMTRQLDQLLEEVRQARLAPSALQREADTMTSWFLPIVVTVSLLTFLFWWRTLPWTTALFRSMSVLLVACPCAMGLATPIAFWGALGALVRRGWRVKSADFIQRLSQVDTVVFDKTGTLSEESLRLKDFVVAANFEREQLLAWIMKIQSLSHHPIARAFQLIPSATSFPCLITSVTSLPAVGLQAFVEIPLTESWVGGRRLLIEMGNHSLLQPRDLPRAEILRKLLKSSQCTHEVWIKVDGQLTGLAQLAETLRASAREAMDQLDRMGIAVQVMTGDTQLSAERLGIPNAQASLTPADKADRVRRLQSQGRRVLFIGDGLNDAAALAEAHASLSPAHASDLAIASSQAVIHHLYWGSVPEVLQMARQTVRGIRFNLCFAAAYNLIGIALAASGLLHPVAAALLMLAASATVTTRALTFAENIQLPPQQRPRPITWRQLLHQRARSLSPVAYLIVLGLMLQAILLIHLTAPSVLGETLIMVLAVLPSLVILNYWKSIDRSPLLQMVASMLSLGNLGMLVGWWADLHFGEMLMQGQVRSCCLQMPSGVLGLWPLSGMQIGMLVASFPLMVMINDPQSILFHSKTGQWLHALVGSLGMLLGMSGATQIFRGVPVLEAHTYFSLFYAAMTVGMLLGMFASCAFWRLCTSFLQPSREEKRIIKATEPYAKLL